MEGRKNWLVVIVVAVGSILPLALVQAQTFSSVAYNTENSGLSHNTVLNMYQDSRGFIWIGTMDGLNRFDGTNFKIYRHNPAESTTLTDSFIHGIFERSNGDLWIGTRDGVFNILDPVTDTIKRINHRTDNLYNIPDKPANLMFEDSKGFFWMGFFTSSIGTFDEELQKFIPANIIQVVTEIPIFSINHVLEMNDGAFIFSGMDGLFYLPSDEVHRFRSGPAKEQSLTATPLIFKKEIRRPKLTRFISIRMVNFGLNLWEQGFKRLM